MAAFQLYLQSGKQEKVWWIGGGGGVDSHVDFGKKILW
jgi:hypothetical protein